MDLNKRLDLVDDELKLLKNEIKQVLLEIQEQVLTIQNPFAGVAAKIAAAAASDGPQNVARNETSIDVPSAPAAESPAATPEPLFQPEAPPQPPVPQPQIPLPQPAAGPPAGLAAPMPMMQPPGGMNFMPPQPAAPPPQYPMGQPEPDYAAQAKDRELAAMRREVASMEATGKAEKAAWAEKAEWAEKTAWAEKAEWAEKAGSAEKAAETEEESKQETTAGKRKHRDRDVEMTGDPSGDDYDEYEDEEEGREEGGRKARREDEPDAPLPEKARESTLDVVTLAALAAWTHKVVARIGVDGMEPLLEVAMARERLSENNKTTILTLAKLLEPSESGKSLTAKQVVALLAQLDSLLGISDSKETRLLPLLIPDEMGGFP